MLADSLIIEFINKPESQEIKLCIVNFIHFRNHLSEFFRGGKGSFQGSEKKRTSFFQ